MVHYRGGRVGGGGWAARGGLNPSLGLFGLAVQEVPAIGPNMLRCPKDVWLSLR